MKQQRTLTSLAAALVALGVLAAPAAHARQQSGDAEKKQDEKQEKQEKKDDDQPQVRPGNDPFYRYQPPKAKKIVEPEKPVPIPPPTLEQRQAEYKRAKAAAKASRQPEPNAVGQFLVSELTVTGVFETDRGLGAFVQAPDKTMYFIEKGTRVYNGELIDINDSADPPQVTFREQQNFMFHKVKQSNVQPVVKTVGPAA